MYNWLKIKELLDKGKIPQKHLLDWLGSNYNGSLKNVIDVDIRASKLEKIADFFGLPIDYFFDRETRPSGVSVSGVKNKVHHFSIGQNDAEVIKSLRELLAEKEKRIELLEELNAVLKAQASAKSV